MMIVSFIHDFQMQIHHGAVGHCIEKLPDHLRVHLSDLFRGKRCLIFQKRATGQIDRRQGASVSSIGRRKESKPPDSPFIACLPRRSPVPRTIPVSSIV